jgi:two-component system nitrogen regulation sensor histidine kinase NtrY
MRNLRFPVVLIVLLFLVFTSFGIELYYIQSASVPFPTKLILLLLINLTVIALLTLMFFVIKNLVKLYFERKHQVPGYKFKTKLVVIFVTLTLIPATVLFIMASGLITTYIDRWFAPQIRQPLEKSLEIAKVMYDIEKQKSLGYAQSLAAGSSVSEGYQIRYLNDIPKDATETMYLGFEGKEGTEVISGDKGDIIRAVVPKYQDGRQTGVIIVESFLPKKITKSVENMKEAYENFLTLESWKIPIKANFLFFLGFFTLIVIFMALWIALRIARGITDPIRNLALATEQVAGGNLDIQVELEGEDEIALLTHSFNDMVTKLKAGNESLQSAYLYMKNILDNINSGVIMLDISGEISMINERACSILMVKQDDIISKHYRDLMAAIDSPELQKLVSGIEGKAFKPLKKEVKAVIENRRVILLVFITSLKDSQKYIGLLVVFDDLTDIIEAQKALTWQDIARRIAHEIKNPLTPIKLSTERMIKKWESRDADFDQVFSRSAKTIVREVDSLKRLVDEFSRFGKMPEILKNPEPLVPIIDEVVNLYKDYKEIEIQVSAPADPPVVELDREQFRRALINLFDNAIQAMKNHGRIDVTVLFDIPANFSYIHIADNGPGIREEDREKLFQPYFSTRKDGTGLGLAIAHRIITEHKGHIRVCDNTPKGTVFSIEIPLKEH